MKKLLIPAAFIIPFAGLLISLALNLTGLPNPVLYLWADLGSIIFGISLLISTGLVISSITLGQFNKTLSDNKLESAAERRRFLRLLDHELKNPLTAIMAGLANLGGVASPEQQNSTMTSVESQVKRINQLVTDLRKLSDLETRPIEHHPVDIPALLQDIYQINFDRISEQRVFNLIIPQTPWPLPEIIGDRDLLFLAVHNLIDNAIKFTQEGDTIEIRASEDGRILLLEIADSGPGIPAEELGLVWDELFPR